VSGIDPTLPKPPTPAAKLASDQAKLRKASHQLEGIFLGQLFQAMRQTVPQADGETSEAQQMFTSMLDDQLAAKAADQLQRGLGEAIYRQLSRQLPKTP
jgi:Rod binding domain-containing protein